jgi:2-iminobutanoate/2-iminopropanoate deaminase
MGLLREVIVGLPQTDDASHASVIVRGGAFLFVSGLIAVDAKTGTRTPGTTAAETGQVLANLKALLERAGSSLDKVVKVNVLLASMLEAQNMNEAYASYFPEPPPARTVCGARLPDGVRVMIECTALA